MMKQITLTLFLSLLCMGCFAQEIGIVAHRGSWNCPEGGYARNSIAALRQSHAKAYQGSEFDINMCADSSLLVFHDSKFEDELIERLMPESLTSHRLENGETIPTIDQFLEAAKECPDTKLVFELKSHSCPEVETEAVIRSIEALRRHGLFVPERVEFISFSFHICKEFARTAPEFHVSYLGFFKSLKALRAAGVDGIDSHHLLVNKARVRKAHKLGMRVNCWTVNKESTVKQMIKAGVDLITTDEPEMVRKCLKEADIKENLR